MITIIKILDWIKSLDKKTLAFIAGAVLVMFMMRQCNRIENLKNEVKIVEQIAQDNLNNYIAANDSIRYLKNENGDLVAQISSYQFNIDDLSSLNKDITKKYRQALQLNEDLEGVKNLLMSEIQIKDSLLAAASVTVVNDSVSTIKFSKFDDFGDGNSRDLTGSLLITNSNLGLIPSNVLINTTQSLTLRAAIESIDGRDQVKISTSYPGLNISGIENINLINNKLNDRNPPKSAGWSVGLGVGYGVSIVNGNTVGIGPTINVGLHWSPKWLRF